MACLFLLAVCAPPPAPGSEDHIRTVTGAIDDDYLIHADEVPGNWLSYGRNYAEDRYSSLDQITSENIDQLGLIWSYELGTKRGIEATPIVVDGILFMSGPWSVVYALDARTGTLIWSWDPAVPRRYADLACCDVVNRGVALYQGKVYVGTLDGRLAALDAATGNLVWETLTVDPNKAYTITGAPRVVDGKVIIGNGGAEFGVRGYISAYDAATGDLIWRTYTVPGDPSQPFESEAMEVAAKTWSGEWWKAGGGGTAWDAMAYDPGLKLLYVGTGNGAPWDRHHRSPGGGDNLYLSSILALNPANGELVWYYQTTPGDSWDFTATQHLMLADLAIEGQTRKVIMQAPKNGFFYVLDRETGAFISAEAYVPVTWAEGIDPETGKPIERTGSDYRAQPTDITPGILGGHNWQPMAYNPEAGLVYIPAQVFRDTFAHDSAWQFTAGAWNAGVHGQFGRGKGGYLLAWDPVKQEEVWRVPYFSPWNGGLLTTAGNLVFQGTGDGRFIAYEARSGKQFWESPTGTGVIAAPVTYLVDGVQYITIMAGWGGAYGLRSQPAGAASHIENTGRVYTFALGGNALHPTFHAIQQQPYVPSTEVTVTPEEVQSGNLLFHQHCARCHGGEAVASGVIIPDLRFSSPEVHESFEHIVLEGLLEQNGMPSFQNRLSSEDIKHIRTYVISRSLEAAKLMSETN